MASFSVTNGPFRLEYEWFIGISTAKQLRIGALKLSRRRAMNLQRAIFSNVLSLILLSFCPAALAEIAPGLPSANASTTSSAVATPTTPKKDGPPSLFEEGQGATEQTATLDVRINVPHAQHPIDVFTVHPYPVKPPKIEKPLAPLPEDPKALKDLLVQSGYIQRESGVRPYPFGGQRWQYAYKAGVAKSGVGVPHGLLTMYSWARDVTPAVKKECIKWNAFEVERKARYDKAVAEFENHRADFESEAVKQGLYAIDLRHRGFGWGVANVPPGNWWLTCTRKVPGLTYYWQVPMTAAPGENIKVVLTQTNALVITGGW